MQMDQKGVQDDERVYRLEYEYVMKRQIGQI